MPIAEMGHYKVLWGVDLPPRQVPWQGTLTQTVGMSLPWVPDSCLEGCCVGEAHFKQHIEHRAPGKTGGLGLMTSGLYPVPFWLGAGR